MIFRWVKLQELSYKGTVRNSDLIYVLGRGSLLESGNHAQLFLGFCGKRWFRWKFPSCEDEKPVLNVNPGVSLFREIWRSKPFPGGCGYLRNLLGCPSSYPDPGRKVVEILRMHTYTETLTWCTKWTADVSQKQKALNSTTVSYTACLHHDHDTARFYSRKIC